MTRYLEVIFKDDVTEEEIDNVIHLINREFRGQAVDRIYEREIDEEEIAKDSPVYNQFLNKIIFGKVK